MIRLVELGTLRLGDPDREVMGAVIACDTQQEVRSLAPFLFREVTLADQAGRPPVPPAEHEPARGLGERIRAARKASGLNMRELAEAAGYTESYVSHIERGLKIPSLKAIESFARALGLEVGALFAFGLDVETRGAA